MIVGVLAAGQLGRMMALEGYPLGLRFRFLEPNPSAPAATLAELIAARYDDTDALAQFAKGIDVATYEFENIPVCAAETLSKRVAFYPPPEALRMAQDRFLEKKLFTELSIPTSPYLEVLSRDDLDHAIREIGLPLVLKSARMGYDGKGQAVLNAESSIDDIYAGYEDVPVLAEEWIPFDRELSLVSARSRSGEVAFYPLVENQHRKGILWETRAPAPCVSDELQASAEACAVKIFERFDYVGVLTIEFFEHEGKLLANEMASRVHNSGHWTLDGAVTSQFENHLRAILGMPLGSTEAVGVSHMVNLIGMIPESGDVLAVPGAHLHLYGKTPRPGRKVGHITLCATTPDVLDTRVESLYSRVAELAPPARPHHTELINI